MPYVNNLRKNGEAMQVSTCMVKAAMVGFDIAMQSETIRLKNLCSDYAKQSGITYYKIQEAAYLRAKRFMQLIPGPVDPDAFCKFFSDVLLRNDFSVFGIIPITNDADMLKKIFDCAIGLTVCDTVELQTLPQRGFIPDQLYEIVFLYFAIRQMTVISKDICTGLIARRILQKTEQQ